MKNVKMLFRRHYVKITSLTHYYFPMTIVCVLATCIFVMSGCSGSNEITLEENENFKIIIESNGNDSVDAIEKSYYIIDKKNKSRSLIFSDTCCSSNIQAPNTTLCLPKDSIMAVNSAKLLYNISVSGLPYVLVESSNNKHEIISFIVSLDKDSVLLLPTNNGFIGQTKYDSLLIFENLKPYSSRHNDLFYEELIAFDYSGNMISKMEAKTFKNYSRELDLADNHFSQITNKAFSRSIFQYHNTNIPYRIAELFSHSEDSPILILFLHGLDAVGTDNVKQLRWDMIRNIYRYLAQNEQHAIIIAPQIPVGNWDVMTTPVKALIDNIVDAENVDRNRIYICGYSLGAKGTWTMIQKYPSLFAGALSAGSPSTPLTTADQYSRTLSTPIWAGNGSAEIDATAQMNRLRQMGADVKYSYKREWGHGEACSSVFNDECFDWLFSHIKK